MLLILSWGMFLCCLQGQSDPLFVKKIQQHRKAYLNDFKKNPASPLGKKELKNVQFFAPDEQYMVLCQFSPTPDAEPFEMPTYSGVTKPYVQYGIAKFSLAGVDYQLSIYRSVSNTLPQYRDYLFVPFKDLSNGEYTYGGGRYLDLRIKDIVDKKLTLDFNKAYNPYCAYSDGYSCPIPPEENHLKVSIPAGEKVFMGKKKHP
ncbi:protein of unknown function DUF1684 [Haliscomenobacter hydrossis DSM 1100]|uniref:DUF1684 domain-containing protein n=2 Tax=Haliscomenobacter TaxID=2349 RepID=F4L0I6_HALH1|nr:protein of unknown function DUF1684 [Haliscomenobacter hydrossis DSM 1100]